MDDRSGNLSRMRTSEDKVRRKDLCGSVRAVYVLEKLPDASGPDLVEVGRYN